MAVVELCQVWKYNLVMLSRISRFILRESTKVYDRKPYTLGTWSLHTALRVYSKYISELHWRWQPANTEIRPKLCDARTWWRLWRGRSSSIFPPWLGQQWTCSSVPSSLTSWRMMPPSSSYTELSLYSLYKAWKHCENPVLLRDQLEHWTGLPTIILDPRLPHQQNKRCECRRLWVRPGGLQCGHQSLLSLFSPLHCRLHIHLWQLPPITTK